MKKITFENFIWTNFKNPTKDDTLYIQKNFNIHPLAAEEFTTPTFRPKATRHEDYIFLTVHFPLFNEETRTTYPGEVDLILTETNLITGHNVDLYHLEELFEKLEKDEEMRKEYMQKGPGYLMYILLNTLTEACFPRLDHIIENINNIEENVFADKGREMVLEISNVKRDILNFRRILKPQASVVRSITQNEHPLLSKELTYYFNDLLGSQIRLWSALESSKETIKSLEETNDSLLSHKLNSTMKILTVFNATLLPIGVYSGIMGISGTKMPFAAHPHAFWIHMSLMVTISALTMLLFRIKKWI